MPIKIYPESKNKGNHDILVCLQILSWRESDTKEKRCEKVWKGEKNREKENGECVRSTLDWQDLGILRLWQLSTTTIIAADGFESYDYILTLEESNIVNLAKGFSDRTVAAGKISFGLRRTNLLKVTIHWDQDFRRISWTPSLIGTSNADEFHT